MKKEVLECENSKSLRQRALDLMHQKPQSITDLPKKEIAELVQELGVYQIELEMQNEELGGRRRSLKIPAADIPIYTISPRSVISCSTRTV